MKARKETVRDRSSAYSKKLPEPSPVYVVDFFAGCGGMSSGFVNTRQSHTEFRVLAGIDIDDHALATYERNISAPGVVQDIALLSETPDLLTEIVPNFDPVLCRPLVFIGCPPCQGFSAHRKKDKRDDPRNNLMLAFAKICEHYKPEAIVMENVPEVLTGKYRHYFHSAAKKLEESGYSLTTDVLDLSLYGVPQRRRRAVVTGALDSSIELPSPIFSPETALTVRDAISHLDPVPSGGFDRHDPDHRAPDHTERILERIRRTPPDGGDRRTFSIEEQLDCHVSLDNGTTPGFTDVYGRLRWDAPSVTITAKSSTPSCGRFLHPEQHRNITAREAAILQGFPQSFAFEGPFINRYRQIGEAVPPLFARFVAWQVLDHFSPRTKNTFEWFSRPEKFLGETDAAKPERHIKVIDCFSGAGGIALGFEAAGFETAYAFDVDTDSVATFGHNVSPNVTEADVRDSELVTAVSDAVADQPFVMVGGPPCQGFSQQRRGDDLDERNNLVLSYADLVEASETKPFAVVLENVTYLDSPRGRRILAEYVARLKKMGYELFRHDLNSAEYGVPQLRHRIVLVALQSHLAEAYGGPSALTPRRWPTLGEALTGVPDPSSDSLLDHLLPNHEASKEGVLNKRRIAYVDMGKGRMAIPPELQLACHTKYNGHLDVYGRLDWFSQARTITVGFDSFTRGEFAHPFRHGSITGREAARIQGFPDWFAFLGNRASVRRQIGNAVPPPMAFAIAGAIAEAFSKTTITREAIRG